jgi:cell division protein FtsA
MEEIIDAVNFEIQNSGYADKLAAGVVITGGGAMLKHLPQLMKFKTAMDVRIGFPNEHLAGSAKNEINQPMYATSVGLIMRGFDYLETYKKTFNAGNSDEFVQPRSLITDPNIKKDKTEESEVAIEASMPPVHEEEKVSFTDKLKIMLSKMFEVEDQPINK